MTFHQMTGTDKRMYAALKRAIIALGCPHAVRCSFGVEEWILERVYGGRYPWVGLWAGGIICYGVEFLPQHDAAFVERYPGAVGLPRLPYLGD